METLAAVLGKDNIIYDVNVDTFQEAILEVYDGDKYIFFHNSELIDVKNRFRIFRFKEKNYISKKMSKKNALVEYNSSLNVLCLLNEKKIVDYTIEIVMPNLFIVDDNYYIVTEYKGNTLQEILYSKKNLEFRIQHLKQLVNLFFKHKISYIGICPRNMVISDEEKKIYLFDFETAEFNSDDNYYNMLFKTNILVNWSYLFNQNELKSIFCESQIDEEKEPKLNQYEINFKQMIGFLGENFELRKIIMNVVLHAEKKVDEQINDFCILPMDMAAIISDLFDYDMDVIMDMVFYLIREDNEELYKKILVAFSKTIINGYKKNDNLQLCTLPLLLLSISLTYTEEMDKMKLLRYYQNNNTNKFTIELNKNLNNIFKSIYADFKISNFNISNLSNYLIKLKNENK